LNAKKPPGEPLIKSSQRKDYLLKLCHSAGICFHLCHPPLSFRRNLLSRLPYTLVIPQESAFASAIILVIPQESAFVDGCMALRN
jgi:hypothetical protein